jgi:3-oxoacyl-[acyl-carrier protein] reductase
MSVAQKTWPVGDGNPMSPISELNSPGNSLPLAGRTALVTGSGRGIGKAIANKLALLGAAVGLCGRNEGALNIARNELQRSGAKVHAQVADITRNADVVSLVESMEKEMCPISILVNNAGIGIFGPVQEKTEQDWDLLMNTNLKSVFLVSKVVAPLMIGRKSGDIINISSLAGKNTFAGGGLYCASKWGLLGLTGCMAEDLRVHGIRVSAICPGSVATEFAGRGGKDPAKVLRPEDVAHAVAMVALQDWQSFISEVHLRPLSKP